MIDQVTIIGLPGVPMVQPGDNLHAIAVSALVDADLALEAGDVLVVAQKIVSKAEGRFVDVTTVTPSARAVKLAEETGKDPRFVQLVLAESKRIVRHRPNLIIAEHRLGFVMANAGIDHSNVAPEDGDTPDQQAMTLAADTIDSILKQDPYSFSESRLENSRIMIVPPLGVAFDVSDADRMATVWGVWRFETHES